MLVDNTETLLDLLQKGEIDFAFIEGNFNKSAYSYQLFSKENFIGICSEPFYKNHKKISLESLTKQKLLLREKGSGTRTVFENILNEYSMGLENFADISEFGNLNVIKDLVEDNVGISFMYEEAVKKDLAKGKLYPLQIEEWDIVREFNFVYLKNSQFEEEYLKFLSFCLNTYSIS